MLLCREITLFSISKGGTCVYHSPSTHPKAGTPRVEPSSAGRFRLLFWRFFVLTILAAILPLGGVGVGAYYVFRDIIYSHSVNTFQGVAESHASLVNVFLAERKKALELASSNYTHQTITHPGEVQRLLTRLNRIYNNSFRDLGVIDQDGNHLVYEGEHDLLQKNYRNEDWFKQVVERGSYISDVFLGFRNTPHFIIAIHHHEEDGFWILRASIDSDVFSRLVSKGAQGSHGDCFLIDGTGRYQTHPRHQAGLLQASGMVPQETFDGVQVVTEDNPQGERVLRVMKWVDEPHWLLVVQQTQQEILRSVHQAMNQGMVVFLLGVLIILAAAYFTTRYLIQLAESAAKARDAMRLQFMQASKLAAIGELATGLAHEINNPLAVILAEQTNLSDVLDDLSIAEAPKEELVQSVNLVRKQVLRCRAITQKMLKFGRQGSVQYERIDPAHHLEEIVGLLEKQAVVNNVRLQIDHEDPLPLVMIDSSEFEQVATNLITNAIQAVGSDGVVLVSAFRDQTDVHLTIEDTGPGIEPQHRDSIFTPFFTTKPPGKGTGLGLSVCYGIITKWNGRIWAGSEPGHGAVFHVTLPCAPSDTPPDAMQGGNHEP